MITVDSEQSSPLPGAVISSLEHVELSAAVRSDAQAQWLYGWQVSKPQDIPMHQECQGGPRLPTRVVSEGRGMADSPATYFSSSIPTHYSWTRTYSLPPSLYLTHTLSPPPSLSHSHFLSPSLSLTLSLSPGLLTCYVREKLEFRTQRNEWREMQVWQSPSETPSVPILEEEWCSTSKTNCDYFCH